MNLRLFDGDSEILTAEKSSDAKVDFGFVRPDGQKQADLTLLNDGKVDIINMALTFGQTDEYDNWVIEDLGVVVEKVPESLKPNESAPLVLSWNPDKTLLGREFLLGNMRIDYDYPPVPL
jgi:hypothetical protein